MNDTTFVKYCEETIKQCPQECTQDEYLAFIERINFLRVMANNEFQSACALAAYYKVCAPEVNTLVCLFE